jgi:hypothetical protein
MEGAGVDAEFFGRESEFTLQSGGDDGRNSTKHLTHRGHANKRREHDSGRTGLVCVEYFQPTALLPAKPQCDR